MPVAKSESERIAELSQSLDLISACVGHFKDTGKKYYWLAVLSQLRALAGFKTDKSGQNYLQSNNLKPLLIDLIEINEIDLQIYSAPPKTDPPPPELAGSIVAAKTWSITPRANFQAYTLKNWLLAPAFHEDRSNTYVNRNRIIRGLSEKQAVHYDDDIDAISDTFRRTQGSRMDGVDFFIFDTAAAVCWFGYKFLRMKALRGEGRPFDGDDQLSEIDRFFNDFMVSLL